MITPQVCEHALARLQSASKTQLQEVRNFFSKRDLESHLAALIDAARGHESNNVPPGAPQYLVLHNQAERLITAYCDRWKTTIDQLNAELPALGRLRQLAQPPLRKAPTINAILILLGSLAIAFGLGLAAAFVRLGFRIGGGR
jgi:uncharacterized protein involved in exopolysaccharide biosynthesis